MTTHHRGSGPEETERYVSGRHSKGFFSHFVNEEEGGCSSIMPVAFLVQAGCFPASPPHASSPPPMVLLHFQMPCHNSSWMCFSQLSSAPAGKTNFLKHRKHPAENILIKQTPHKILFWGGRDGLRQSVGIVFRDARRQAGGQEPEPNGLLLEVVLSWAHGLRAWPFNLAWVFLNHRSLSPLGISKCFRNLRIWAAERDAGSLKLKGESQSS